MLEEVEDRDSVLAALDFPDSVTPNVSSNHLKVGNKYILHISLNFQVVTNVKDEEEGRERGRLHNAISTKRGVKR